MMEPGDVTEDGELVVPDDVKVQLDAVRESGTHNMLTEIEQALKAYEFKRAYEWYTDNREAYTKHAMRGGLVAVSDTE